MARAVITGGSRGIGAAAVRAFAACRYEVSFLYEKEHELARAVAEGNPAGETAQAACAAHARWIQGFWPAGMYTRQAHLGLGQMYLADERFTAYYDAIAPGCTQFLVRALGVYCGQSGENGCVR